MSQLTARLHATFDRVCETDFTLLKPFVLLTVVFFAVRLPFVNYGHGTDPDAWRVALTAHHLLETGDYYPSRLPGNPLHELVMTLFIPGGWIATNLATACASLLGVYVFALIVRHVGLPNRGLLIIGFAFAPLLIINSIATMDYMWTLTALLVSYYFALKRRPVLSGIAMGCAVGFRLQSVLLWPAIVYLLWRDKRVREIPAMSLAAGGAAMLTYSPVLVVYGLKFFNFYDASVAWQDVLRLLGKEALGVTGALGLLLGLALSYRRLRDLPHDLRYNVQVGVWVLVIVAYFVSFSRLPHEIAYLIPVFPFGILLMGRYFTRTALAIAVVAILFSGLFDLTTPGDQLTLASLKTARPGWGLLISNAQTMQGQHEFIDHIMANNLPDHSVVLAGFIYPQLGGTRTRQAAFSGPAAGLRRDQHAHRPRRIGRQDEGHSLRLAADLRHVPGATFAGLRVLSGAGRCRQHAGAVQVPAEPFRRDVPLSRPLRRVDGQRQRRHEPLTSTGFRVQSAEGRTRFSE